jgi:hypothetical protein
MERMHVNAILSDYDGTLCPTTSVRDDNSYGVGGTIPETRANIISYIQTYTCMHNIQ